MAAHELDPDDSTMLLLEALESTRQTNKRYKTEKTDQSYGAQILFPFILILLTVFL